MKKIMMFVAMMVMFVACQESVEDKAKSYVENINAAREAGDIDKAEALLQEATLWTKTLSLEEQAEIAPMFVACQSREEQIREKAEYIVKEAAEASANQDWDRLGEIVEEEEAFCAGLTDEEMEIYTEAVLEAGSDLMEDVLDQLK